MHLGEIDPLLTITQAVPASGDDRLDRAATFAVANLARTMKRYDAGYGMTNCPPGCLMVGRDTGWMAIGLDHVAPEFAAASLDTFRLGQLPSGRIPEVVVGDSGHAYDYGLNVSDNTPLWAWAVWHHRAWHGDDRFPGFHETFAPAMVAAGEHLLEEIAAGDGLLRATPAGDGNVYGIAGWRNIIDGRVQAGAVTEVNCLSAVALEAIGRFTGEARFGRAAAALAETVRRRLRRDDGLYLIKIDPDGAPDAQVSGDLVFPALTGVADGRDSAAILDRLAAPDFWSPAGLRTLPTGDPDYHPTAAAGLLGGSWPNLTLWYAAACARWGRREECRRALLTVAAPALADPEAPWPGAVPGEFCEYFHGDDGHGLGMPLSPWVPPTYLWALVEGLLGRRPPDDPGGVLL